MQNKRWMRPALGGVLAAVIALATLFLRIPLPATGGYAHLGDAVILWAGLLLGPYAALPAAIGSALADLLGGYALYALPTMVIKAWMAFIVGRYGRENKIARNVGVCTVAGLCMVAGYFLFEWVTLGLSVATLEVVPNLLQGAVGVIGGLMLGIVAGPKRILRP